MASPAKTARVLDARGMEKGEREVRINFTIQTPSIANARNDYIVEQTLITVDQTSAPIITDTRNGHIIDQPFDDLIYNAKKICCTIGN